MVSICSVIALIVVIACSQPSGEVNAQPSPKKTETVNVILEVGEFAGWYIFTNDPVRSEFNGMCIYKGDANEKSQKPILEKCWPEFKGTGLAPVRIITILTDLGYSLKSATSLGQFPVMMFEK